MPLHAAPGQATLNVRCPHCDEAIVIAVVAQSRPDIDSSDDDAIMGKGGKGKHKGDGKGKNASVVAMALPVPPHPPVRPPLAAAGSGGRHAAASSGAARDRSRTPPLVGVSRGRIRSRAWERLFYAISRAQLEGDLRLFCENVLHFVN